MVVGLAADYTAERFDFVRQLCRPNVGLAIRTRTRDTLRAYDSFVLAMEPPEGASQERTMLQIGMAQAQGMPLFCYNDKRRVLRSSGGRS